MPWEKQFDVDEALGKAMRAFWSKGYEATSMRDLVDAMGVNRGSLYATFGDKRALFIEALRRYSDREVSAVLSRARSGRSPREAVQALFDEVTADAGGGRNRDGCFLVNTALELAPHDADIAKLVSSGFEVIQGFFRERIKEGQALGEINAAVDARDVARMLLAALIGIRVISRSWPDQSLLNSIAAQAMALLD
ncbi:MAG TPA: TetR/AcrR family transcriptional regulator [Gammaproteobacteria bacterium]|nr:TetR/AcrR family transcriptional regulator [Gammaproteobacteria bacterium]